MTTHPNHNTADQSGADILKGHASLAEMVGTHIGQWRDALCFLSESCKREGNFDSFSHVVHELNALDDIEKACAALASAQPAPKLRDREADRARFPDAAFNHWLDESITENGEYSVWHQIGDTCSAWHGWENNAIYATPQPFPAPAVQSGELPVIDDDIVDAVYEAAVRVTGDQVDAHQVVDFLKIGRHTTQFAKNLGWNDDDGEGAFEFVQRTSYAQGLVDAPKPTQAIAQTAPAVADEAITDDLIIRLADKHDHRVIFPDGEEYQFDALSFARELLSVAAPSPTEQASEVRNAVIEECATLAFEEVYDMPFKPSFDRSQLADSVRNSILSLKSATAAKGNAQDEVKL